MYISIGFINNKTIGNMLEYVIVAHEKRIAVQKRKERKLRFYPRHSVVRMGDQEPSRILIQVDGC